MQVNAQPAPATPPPVTTPPPAVAPAPKTQAELDADVVAAAQRAEAGKTPASSGDAFRDEIDKGCGITRLPGCFLLIIYYTYFQLPSLILYVSAQFFNAMINIGIDSALTISSVFIPMAWAVVRDLSNIFFILILLYIAIQTILGIGHETKKMIAKVVIIALLINFSMFFTKVVIDSSNIFPNFLIQRFFIVVMSLLFCKLLTISTIASSPSPIKTMSAS